MVDAFLMCDMTQQIFCQELLVSVLKIVVLTLGSDWNFEAFKIPGRTAVLNAGMNGL